MLEQNVCENCHRHKTHDGHCRGVTYVNGQQSDIKVDTCDNFVPLPMPEKGAGDHVEK